MTRDNIDTSSFIHNFYSKRPITASYHRHIYTKEFNNKLLSVLVLELLHGHAIKRGHQDPVGVLS